MSALRWNAEALWEQLEPLLPDLSVEVVARAASTNTALLERARVVGPPAGGDDQVLVRQSVESGAFGRRAADIQPCLLVAEQQTAGRGRNGRVWKSEVGASLTFSLSLPMAVSDWSGLSLAVGVALAGALEPRPEPDSPRIALKWPNDLWLMDGPLHGPGRKFGGILIETVMTGSTRLAVIGIGLNVRPLALPIAGALPGSLQQIDPDADAPTVLARIARPLVLALKRFEREGFAPFAEGFDARDLLRGRDVCTTSPGALEGVAEGVSAQGALLLQTAGGTRPVSSGEVSVRLGEPPPGLSC